MIFKNSKVSSNPINSKVKARILHNILKCCISGDKTSFSKYLKSNIHTPISPKEKIIEFELKVKPKKNYPMFQVNLQSCKGHRNQVVV